MRIRFFVAAALLLASPLAALAEDMPTFRLEMGDGKFSTTRIEAPARTRFKIEVVNKGKTPAEFESLQLRKEKVLAPGAESFVVFQSLSPGEYRFYDDFHPSAQGVIVVK
ncbi:MAG: cupredoxin domain-containing protein [Paludibacterium sp.]|uniref:cupredoxin domain-containing protein n=1 Tax=Paludibacterium sp. TaxID=1917523 RepID=UPI0025F95EB2|nr:cupredoxin domain-containing protein [Paludibacterium sp.]MBV8047253.1 cupredoxin domain-containing protein [Paludibacterium sp.]MBV8647926.1 cupredoxin domain-containing protein [Paludibacterium sp.]